MARFNLRSLLLLLLLSTLLIATMPSMVSADGSSNKLPPVLSEAGRRSWPELVGMPGPEAQIAMKAAHPDWKIDLIEDGSMVTMDYREDRVRIWIDEDGKVSRAPTIG